jgi:hypothetical protein
MYKGQKRGYKDGLELGDYQEITWLRKANKATYPPLMSLLAHIPGRGWLGHHTENHPRDRLKTPAVVRFGSVSGTM